MVVTGLGMISPLGASTQSSWTGLLEGRSGIDSITQFDMKSYPVRFGGEVPEFPVTQYLSPKEIRRMDGFIQFGLVTGIQAMQDSGLEVTEENRSRIGVAVGSGIGGISTIETCYDVLATRGPGKVSPFFVPSSVINMVAGHLSIMFGLTGPNISISTACATGTHNIGFAARLIASGDADVMLAGGSEKAISPTTMAGFGAMKALSTRNEDPSSASRPWDRDRDGFVLSDGSATLVLEGYKHAMARRAKIYCDKGTDRSLKAFRRKQEETVGKDVTRMDRQALFTDDKSRRQAEQFRIEGEAKQRAYYLRAVSQGIQGFYNMNKTSV